MPNSSTSSMWEAHVSGCQLDISVVVSAHRKPAAVKPWRTYGLSLMYCGSSKFIKVACRSCKNGMAVMTTIASSNTDGGIQAGRGAGRIAGSCAEARAATFLSRRVVRCLYFRRVITGVARVDWVLSVGREVGRKHYPRG